MKRIISLLITTLTITGMISGCANRHNWPEDFYGIWDYDGIVCVSPFSSFIPSADIMPTYILSESVFKVDYDNSKDSDTQYNNDIILSEISYVKEELIETEFASLWDTSGKGDPNSCLDISKHKKKEKYTIYRDGIPLGYTLFVMDNQLWYASGGGIGGNYLWVCQLKKTRNLTDAEKLEKLSSAN